MSDRLKWWLSLGGCSLVLAALMVMPQMRHRSSELYQGINIQLNSDEPIYLARVQESLSGRPELAAEAFTGHPGLKGTQAAFIESWYGRLFGWTEWKAGDVLYLMDAVAPVLIFLSLVLFFQLCGFTRFQALGGAAVFCLIELYNLGRPIHMRASFFIMLWSLIGVIYAVRGRWWGAVLGSWLLGLLIGIYVWSFTFAWAFWGIFFAWEFLEWIYRTRVKKRGILQTAWKVFWHFRPRRPVWKPERWHLLGIVGFVGILCGLPAIAHLVNLTLHPLYEYGSFRSGMHHGRFPESWAYAAVFLGMIGAVLLSLRENYEELRPYRPACVLIFTAFVYMNQQVVHGITFNFVSHGIFSLAIAAVAMVLLFLAVRSRILAVGAVAACVYLAAIGYDGRFVLGQWEVPEGRFANQHLSEAITVLDALPRGRILSDPATQALIASNTHHDIVYSIYLKNVLMTHHEIAMRFCLTQLPLRPDKRLISERGHLVYPDAVSAFGGDLRAQEEAMVFAACKELDLDPNISIQTYEISHIFWNKKQVPDWNIDRLHMDLDEIASGEQWVLYKINEAL
ncbi:MAG: hypothetical protein HOG89_01075 [Candidatus Peribacter sp.]|mgnify:CR=1 FL=1|jgi:hypothetical protein|nr:hypothetical protein [Candidatus Peribacter sp.]MBT4393240.1 hypothetical protein [Candidatus Peribacter sp.]MBT4601135.1 hypothetical protein [Candidatus Peribacter sp.]MBT5148905.1 hypothetical protein [Candidatus Peribacter sp.]MBT5637216.1 hypothetical protein [Candidatus Peribacter sp.]